MSKLSDNYPVGMSECDENGLFGNCGENCRKYQNGDCDIVNEEKIYNNTANMSAVRHLVVEDE